MYRLALILSSLMFFCEPSLSADFYVASDGNDADDGSESRPFATIVKARDAARAITGEARNIYLRGGTHYLSRPVVLEAEDSGTPNHPLMILAYPNEKVIVSGGARLKLEWRELAGGIFSAKVAPEFTTDQLFIDGKRQHMARYPNFDASAQYFNGSAADCVSTERAARWKDPRGAFFHAMHSAHWGDMHYLVTGKDESGKLLYEGGWQNNRPSRPHREHRFVENVFEELDAPGEWFLNSATDTLYVIPPKGVDLSQAKMESVVLEQLFELRGSQKNPVRHVVLRDLALTHTARTFMKNREPLLRSDWTTWRGGAVYVTGAEDCRLERLTIEEAGSNAIFVDNYNRRLEILSCHVRNAGASSISFVGNPESLRSPLFRYEQKNTFEGMDRKPGPKGSDFPADCLVDDCLLTRNGRFEKQTAGVNITMAESITVRRSTVYDVPRAGINICDGAFGGHLIEHCDVFDTVKETGDHGSFNSWGRDRFWHSNRRQTESWVRKAPEMPLWDAHKTTVIRRNRWRCDLGWDIDLDDGSSNYHIYENLCLSGGIKLREGYRRVVENNVLVNNTFHPHVWYEKSDSVFRRNIVFAPHAPAGMAAANYGPGVDENFLHSEGGKLSKAKALQRVSSEDARSLAGDALFVNADAGDYRVRKNSPALRTGFRNFSMNSYGVVSPWLMRLTRKPVLPGSAEEALIVNRGWGQSKVLSPHKASRKARWQGCVVRNIRTEGDRSAAGLDSVRGVLVLSVDAKSVGARSGLQAEDVILGIASERIDDVPTLVKLSATRKGSRVTLEIWRQQSESTLSVELP